MKRAESKNNLNAQSDWQVLSLLEFPMVTNYGKSPSRNIIRVCKTNANTAIMADIRLWIGNRPSKTGVAFHLPEIRWLSKILETCEEGTLERPHRVIMVSKVWCGTRFSVTKRKSRETRDILLEADDLKFMKSTLPEMITYMTEQSTANEIATEFVVGEKVVERVPSIPSAK